MLFYKTNMPIQILFMIDICSVLETQFELVFEGSVLLFPKKSLAGMSVSTKD